MAAAELPRIATAVLQVATQLPLRIECVTPVDVEVKADGSDGDLPLESVAPGGRGGVAFQRAYLCMGQTALWFVDLPLSKLLRRSMDRSGIAYMNIKSVEVFRGSDCPQTLCINLRDGLQFDKWSPHGHRVFLRAEERTKLVSHLQMFWSICHVQSTWTLPGRAGIRVDHDVFWPKERDRSFSMLMSPGGGGSGGAANGAADPASGGLDTAVAPDGTLSTPGREALERLDDYLFWVPHVRYWLLLQCALAAGQIQRGGRLNVCWVASL
jgi:hypothetical protein